MYIYIYIYVFIYPHTHTAMYIHIYICICIHICIYKYIHMYMYIYNIFMYTHISRRHASVLRLAALVGVYPYDLLHHVTHVYVCTHTHTHPPTPTHTHIHICIYTHTHTCHADMRGCWDLQHSSVHTPMTCHHGCQKFSFSLLRFLIYIFIHTYPYDVPQWIQER